MNVSPNIPFDPEVNPLPQMSVPVQTGRPRLHRIADVRRRQGISVRSAARRLHGERQDHGGDGDDDDGDGGEMAAPGRIRGAH